MKRLALAFLLVLASYSVSSAQQPVIVYSPLSGTSQPQFPVTSTNPFPVVCESGCSGGAVFGPTAAGSAAANPPVLIGGTVDGTATGLVQGAEIDTNKNLHTVSGASQNKIGNVGGSTKEVCVSPTTTSATYGANVVIGGLLTFANLFTSTGSGVIQSVTIDFNTAQTVGFKLYPFNANPSNSTWTDHSAASINSADIFKVEPWLSLTNADSGLGTMTVYSQAGIGQAYSTGGTSGYFVLVPQATTASLAATSSAVQVCVTVLQDL